MTAAIFQLALGGQYRKDRCRESYERPTSVRHYTSWGWRRDKVSTPYERPMSVRHYTSWGWRGDEASTPGCASWVETECISWSSENEKEMRERKRNQIRNLWKTNKCKTLHELGMKRRQSKHTWLCQLSWNSEMKLNEKKRKSRKQYNELTT
jgi:hypothetical protein